MWSTCGSKGFVSGRGYDQPQFPKCPRPRWLPQICEFYSFSYIFRKPEIEIPASFNDNYVLCVREIFLVFVASDNAWKLPGAFQAHVSVPKAEICLLQVTMFHSGIVWKDILINKGRMRKYNDLFIQCFSTFYVVFKLSNNLSSPFLGPILFVSLK